MNKQSTLKLFEDKKVRTAWDEEQGKWYISIVDVVDILTESPNPNNYWKVLKNRLKKENNQYHLLKLSHLNNCWQYPQRD